MSKGQNKRRESEAISRISCGVRVAAGIKVAATDGVGMTDASLVISVAMTSSEVKGEAEVHVLVLDENECNSEHSGSKAQSLQLS